MTKTMILVITLLGASVLLHGMDFGRKKTGKLHMKQLSNNSESSAEESDGSGKNSSGRSASPAPNGTTNKLSIKSLNDIGSIRQAKDEINEKKRINKSDGLLEKKGTFSIEQK